MYLYWGYSQGRNYASANNILKMMNFKKIYILHFLAHILTPTLICHCVHDDIVQVPLVPTHFVFSCQLPSELRAPWTYFFIYSDNVVATNALSDLKVWIEQPLPGGLPGRLLNDTFRKNLKVALLGG